MTMLKFALFLLIGNGLGFFGNSIAIYCRLPYIQMCKYYSWGPDAIVFNALLVLSLIATPILILVYFKPVRIQMKKYALRVCGKWCRRRLVPSKQDPMTVMMLAPPPQLLIMTYENRVTTFGCAQCD